MPSIAVGPKIRHRRMPTDVEPGAEDRPDWTVSELYAAFAEVPIEVGGRDHAGEPGGELLGAANQRRGRSDPVDLVAR